LKLQIIISIFDIQMKITTNHIWWWKFSNLCSWNNPWYKKYRKGLSFTTSLFL